MSVLVGRIAPDFTAPAILHNDDIVERFQLSQAIKGKYSLIFFYPLDFTFVCPSELIALDKRMSQFKALNVEIIAISIDSQFTHRAWRNTPIEKGGIGPVSWQILRTRSANLGIEHPEAGIAFRAAFLLDASSVVRSEIVNDLPIGRNIDELLRLVNAIQYHEKNGEVCPSGWKKGDMGIKPTLSGISNFLENYVERL